MNLSCDWRASQVSQSISIFVKSTTPPWLICKQCILLVSVRSTSWHSRYLHKAFNYNRSQSSTTATKDVHKTLLKPSQKELKEYFNERRKTKPQKDLKDPVENESYAACETIATEGAFDIVSRKKSNNDKYHTPEKWWHVSLTYENRNIHWLCACQNQQEDHAQTIKCCNQMFNFKFRTLDESLLFYFSITNRIRTNWLSLHPSHCEEKRDTRNRKVWSITIPLSLT